MVARRCRGIHGVAFSLPTFITGLEVYQGLTPWQTILALVIGSAMIFVIGTAMGGIGSETRMSSYLLTRIAFGDYGAGVVNVAFAISLLGWFGININLFADAVSGLSQTLFGIAPSSLLPVTPRRRLYDGCDLCRLSRDQFAGDTDGAGPGDCHSGPGL